MKAINTTNAPAAIGPYSQAIEACGTVYVSGQLPIDPATGVFAPGGIQEQTHQSLTNIKAILEAAGTGMQNVIKTTVYLSDMANRKRLGLDAGITWKTLRGKGQLMLMARDILNQMKTVFSNIQPYERTDYRLETMHRYLCLTFTYNFDAKGSKKGKK